MKRFAKTSFSAQVTAVKVPFPDKFGMVHSKYECLSAH